jgi:hypothetical protein
MISSRNARDGGASFCASRSTRRIGSIRSIRRLTSASIAICWSASQKAIGTIYEKDRLDPVDPAADLSLDRDLLERFPEGYRHLAYLQTQIGYNVKTDMPGLKGPEVEALYERGQAWLAGP